MFHPLKSWLAVCLLWLAGGAAFAQDLTLPELNITLGAQRVTFAPMRNFLEMRLEVTDAKGENVFSQLTAEATLAWNLRAGNGEALAPGLYRYALTLKYSEDQSTTQRGHFIVEQGQQQIWLTTNDGADISGDNLNVARTGGRSLAGLRTGEDSTKREVSGRGITEEKKDGTPTEDKPGLREKAALAGTVNRIAKYAADGTTLVDSMLSETVSGTDFNLNFGIPNPIWQVTNTGQSRTYDTTSGLQAGFSAYTHRHAANISNYPRTLMLGYSPGTTINYGFYAASGQATGATQIPSFFGISTNANVKQAASKQMFLYQSPTAGVITVLSSENLGAGQGTDLFLGGSTANGADAPLTIKTTGNVGIGVTAPAAKLDVAGDGFFSSDVTIGGIDGKAYNPNVRLHVDGPPATTNVETAQILQLTRPVVSGVKNTNSAGFSVGSFETGIIGRTRLDLKLSGLPTNSNVYGRIPDVTVMSLLGNGNVGIGITAPSAAKLHVDGGNLGAVFGSSQSNTGFGLTGYASAATGFTRGVYGQADSSGGIGVHGYSPSSVGVLGTTVSGTAIKAQGSGGGTTALEISNGAIRVNGSSAPVFVLTVQSGSNTCANGTAISFSSPYTDNRPDAILFVTPSVVNQSLLGGVPTVEVAYFDNSAVGNPPCPAQRWFIQTTNLSSLPSGLRLNVMVINP